MISQKEESLQLALQKTGLRKLPKAMKQDGTQTFLSAIVLTRRSNGTEAYAYAENDGDGKPHIKKDFGPCVTIASIEEVYPVQILDKKVIPDLRSDKQIMEYLSKGGYERSEIETLLSRADKTSEQINSDRNKVKQYVTRVAIECERRRAQEEERVAKIRSYKSRINNGEK